MEPETVVSPLCLYQTRCAVAGRAELGPEQVLDGAVNRAITCLTCGRRGVESRSTDPKRPGLFLKIDTMGELPPRERVKRGY